MSSITAFTPIKNWRDVKPFQGQMVAYKTSLRTLFRSDYTFSSDEGELHFGYIDQIIPGFDPYDWRTDSWGYEISRLIQKGYKPYDIALTDGLVKVRKEPGEAKEVEPLLFMRAVTQNEFLQIIEAVKKNKAYFGWLSLDKSEELYKTSFPN